MGYNNYLDDTSLSLINECDNGGTDDGAKIGRAKNVVLTEELSCWRSP